MSEEDDLLQVGDRVRLSELGERRLSRARVKTGTVVGFGMSQNQVRVRLDGHSQPITFMKLSGEGGQKMGRRSRRGVYSTSSSIIVIAESCPANPHPSLCLLDDLARDQFC